MKEEDCGTLDWVTEADEDAQSVVSALRNLRWQIYRQETLGVIAMYEQSARKQGVTTDVIEALYATTRAAARETKCVPIPTSFA